MRRTRTGPRQHRVHVIVNYERSRWFVAHVLGLFWETGPRKRAKEFASRKAALAMLTGCGKHRTGWHVVSECVPWPWPEASTRNDLP